MLVLTKADLVDNAREFVGRAATVQGDLAVESVNAKDAAALDGVRRWIDPRATVALLGSSGVGKSTLLNALAGRDVATTALRNNLLSAIGHQVRLSISQESTP